MIGYHCTALSRLSSILEHGLTPAIGPRSKDCGEVEPAIYFFRDLASAEDGLVNWMSDVFEEDSGICILQVDLTGCDVQNYDEQFELLVTHTVEPSRIQRVLDESLIPIKFRTAPPHAGARRR